MSGPESHVRTSQDAPAPLDFLSLISNTSFQYTDYRQTPISFILNEHGSVAKVKVPCICGIYSTSVHPRQGDPSIEAVVRVPSKANVCE